MVTDGQVRKLWRLLGEGRSLAASSRMTGMDEKTARSYRDDERLPSHRRTKRAYRTRVDPFADVWPEVQQRLEAEPKLQAVTLFSWLQDRDPGQYLDSTRRTFERRARLWRSALSRCPRTQVHRRIGSGEFLRHHQGQEVCHPEVAVGLAIDYQYVPA